jgi:hypothetical protein
MEVAGLPALGACKWGYHLTGGYLFARVFPTGRVYVQAEVEWKQSTVFDAASLIKAKQSELNIRRMRATFADPLMFRKQDDEKIVIEPIADVFARFGVPMVESDDDRPNGWQRVHDYMALAPDGRPWLIISPDCTSLARVLPTVTQRESDPEDTDSDFWAAHALRLLLAARPSAGSLARRAGPFPHGTVGWLRTRDRQPQGLLTRQR